MSATAKSKSSFPGKIDEIPEICVDNFENKESAKAYFLSHVHSDHTVGLFGGPDSAILRDNGNKIYMSEKSKIILSHKHFNYNGNLKSIVEPLKIGFTYTINISDTDSFQVTLIPVQHMIGAVMFLFKTKDKKTGNDLTVLYTGDFVVQEEEIFALEKLHKKDGMPIKIDSLYVDATFDNEDYEHFPRRDACHEEVLDAATEWLEKGEDRRVALFSYYMFGYEEIYKTLHENLNIKVFMPRENRQDVYALYRELYGSEDFITSDATSKIHICKNDKRRVLHSSCGIRSAGLEYLHILMSAQQGCFYDEGERALTQTEYGSYYLCYPTHCSKSQLEYFLNYFNAGKVTKFPKEPVATPTYGIRPYRENN